MNTSIQISTEKEKLDIALIHGYLSRESYWAKGRSMEEVELSIVHSLCFGAYAPGGRQLGFARVLTDQVVVAWLMDVFVIPEARGQGIGKQLLEAVLDHPQLQAVNGIGLRTEDAHAFYRRYGFEVVSLPQTWMYRTNRKSD